MTGLLPGVLGQAVMGRERSWEEAPRHSRPALTTDILAQDALGLFHCGLQTKYWPLEGREERPESLRGLGFPGPSLPRVPWPRLATSSSLTRCSIRWCSSGCSWKACEEADVVCKCEGRGRGGQAEKAEPLGPGCRKAEGWRRGSPPVDIPAARRPWPHGWAPADPGGAGQCRVPPHRAGPAEAQQGHIRNCPRQPPLTATLQAQGRDRRPMCSGGG